MSRIAQVVATFVANARNSPAEASDPANLEKLLDACDESWDGRFTALNSPVAPLTWESRMLLAGVANSSNRIPFQFPNSVEVVGLRPSVIATTTGGGLLIPTAEDIEVSIDKDQSLYYTQAQGAGLSADGLDGTYVTLASVGVQVPRLWGIKLTAEKPTLGFTLRWKRPVLAGPTAIYQDALVSIAMYCKPINQVPIEEMSRTTGNRA